MVSKAAALLTAALQPEELFQEWEKNDERDWPAEGSDVDPGIRLGKVVEIPNQCRLKFYKLQLRSSQKWNNHKWLNVRWVLQKRGHMWWCERIAKDFKASNPEAPGLFICASFLMAGRMNNYYAVTHPDYEMMVGIIVQDELVICEAPEEVKMLARQMERDAGSVDEAEEQTPIRFEEISSRPQIGEFGVEMRHPQDSSTPPASSTLESKDSSTPPVSSTLESSDSLGPQYWPSCPFDTSPAIGSQNCLECGKDAEHMVTCRSKNCQGTKQRAWCRKHLQGWKCENCGDSGSSGTASLREEEADESLE